MAYRSPSFLLKAGVSNTGLFLLNIYPFFAPSRQSTILCLPYRCYYIMLDAGTASKGEDEVDIITSVAYKMSALDLGGREVRWGQRWPIEKAA